MHRRTLVQLAVIAGHGYIHVDIHDDERDPISTSLDNAGERSRRWRGFADGSQKRGEQ